MFTPIIQEDKQPFFKFWFDGQIYDGFYYHNELFYRLQTLEAEFRPQLYHSACQLAHQEPVIVTVSNDTCSLWVSFQSPNDHVLAERAHIVQQFGQLEESSYL
ncbi:MAG: hypothetical protein VKL39_05255 [Leptolyngbyaceae bacterium]|nr:hypothetical protein [Leptolyngbyaceae bacterium]